MPKLIRFEENLLQRIDYHKTNPPMKSEGNKLEFKEWYDTVYTHLLGQVIPLIKKNGETYITYWPGKYLTGLKKEYKRAYYEKQQYLNVSGIFGTGYIAMTIENLYLISLKKLTEKYPKFNLGVRRFFDDVLDRMTGEVNNREPLLLDKIQKISIHSIIDAQIILDDVGVDVVSIRTPNQNLLFYTHFNNDDEDMVNCLQYAISGKFNQLISKSKQDYQTQEVVVEKLRRLKELYDEGIISKEEFVKKNEEFLSML
jgi:hypothetical protein